MSMLSRLKLWLQIRANTTLDNSEDPRDVMNYALIQQQQMLRKVRHGLIEVATSRHQLEHKIGDQEKRLPILEQQAQQAVDLNRQDLARRTLQRKQIVLSELGNLSRQLDEMAADELKLAAAEQELSRRVEQFRTRRNVAITRYQVAQTRVKVNEALAGVSGEMGELYLAIGRAEEKTERMLARASALDALMGSGGLELPAPGDSLEYEMWQMSANQAVEAELLTLTSGGAKRSIADESRSTASI